MNLTAHIIRKDLVRFRWALLVWGLSFLYLAVRPNLAPAGSVAVQDYFQVMALITFAVLCVALISGVVQEDHPTDSSGHWRTRPISPGRLLSAKLLLIGALFVGLPLLTVWGKNHFGFSTSVAYFREYCLIALVLTSLSLSFTAAAACTKNVLHCVLLWVGVVFASENLAEALNRVLPKLSMQLSMEMNNSRVITLLAFSTVMGLAIILNQYLRRRLTASIVLLVVGSVGSALMGTLWIYYYFYQG